MGSTLKKLTTDLAELKLDTIEGMEIIVKGLDILLENVDSPWGEAIKSFFPPAGIAISLLKEISFKSKDLDTCTALVIQQAYMETLRDNLLDEKDKLKTRFNLNDKEINKKFLNPLKRAIQKAKSETIDATQVDFQNLHRAKFVKENLEKVTELWLKTKIFKTHEDSYDARNFARRISYQLYPRILRIIAENPTTYAPLAEFLEKSDHRRLREQRDIERYKASLMSLPLRAIFDETFSLQDIYVELNAIELKWPREIAFIPDYEPRITQMMNLVLENMEDQESVIYIQAGPGKGKSVFCQMLAAKIAKEFPDWLPVLVPLRDIYFKIDDDIESLIHQQIKDYFSLTDELLRTIRFFFILDGFDELLLSAEPANSLKFFFERLAMFQNRSATSEGWNHKILVTGRPMSIYNMEAVIPNNFYRIEIDSMKKVQFEQWLNNWRGLFGDNVSDSFRKILEESGVFEDDLYYLSEEDLLWFEKESLSEKGIDEFQHERGVLRNNISEIGELAREPLLLYMLGAMHKDGILTPDILKGSQRIEIYDRIIDWVSGNTKRGIPHRANIILRNKPHEIRKILQEIALCIFHGGREYAPIERIKSRLEDRTLDKTKTLLSKGFGELYKLLASFYFQESIEHSGNVEFSHKSFGEFLVAEKMAQSLIDIGSQYENTITSVREDILKDIRQVANEFYAVFGPTLITDEIAEYLVGILRKTLAKKNTISSIEHIQDRLYALYLGCDNGKWMDRGITRNEWNDFSKYRTDLNLLKFEAQTRLNLFIIISLLCRETNSEFFVCGDHQKTSIEPNRFRRFIGICESLEVFDLRKIYRFMGNINLEGANLCCLSLQQIDLKNKNLRRVNLTSSLIANADLSSADLTEANMIYSFLVASNLERAILSNAKLNRANLQNAKLLSALLIKSTIQKANLRGADLRGADLSQADLTGSNLSEVDLRGANLQSANLLGADLTNADLSGCNMMNANFSNAILRSSRMQKADLDKYADVFTTNQLKQINIVLSPN